ncbi:MAG: HEAT repeat domain-containing protein [Anaerolineales bacterium]
MKGWHFDLVSFLIGVLTSGLAFYLSYRFRTALQTGWQALQQVFQNTLPARSNIEIQLRKEIVRFCQKEHLVHRLFALDELLIPARVLPLVPPWDKKEETLFEDITLSAVPLIYDDPLLSSTYRRKSFSLLEILAHGNPHLLLIGELGAGKTTALIEATLKIARSDHPYKDLHPYLPLYIHATRLLKEDEKNKDMVLRLVEAARIIFTPSVRRSLPRIVRKAIRNQNLILLLDGLDELPPPEIDKIADYLKLLLKQYPLIKIILAVSPNYLSDFVSMGFSPLLLCTWDKNETRSFLEKWSIAWQNANLASADEIALWTAWANQEKELLTPLEWTLFLLLLFSKSPKPARSISLLESSLCFTKLDPSSRQEIANWSKQFLANQLQNISTPPPPGAIEKLTAEEIFALPSAPIIRFRNSIYLSLFASYTLHDHEEIQSFLNSKWSIAVQAALIAQSHLQTIALPQQSEETKQGMIHLAKTFSYIGQPSEELRGFLKRLANLILTDREPKYFRVKLLSTLLRFPLEDRIHFVKFLIQSKEPFLRQIGALAYGLLGIDSHIQTIQHLLEDPVSNCFQAACLALVNIGTSEAIDAVIAALIHGHDGLKEAAAQALANDLDVGFAILREAAQHEDGRVRKAAIAGLLRIQAPWSQELLQKMAIEEELWLVKDAAANALAFLDLPNPWMPQKPPEPANLPWLIRFASQKGIGLSPGKPNMDVLLMALEEGDLETQQAALEFFLFKPVDSVIPTIENLLNSPNPELQSAAYRTLWSFSLCREASSSFSALL